MLIGHNMTKHCHCSRIAPSFGFQYFFEKLEYASGESRNYMDEKLSSRTDRNVLLLILILTASHSMYAFGIRSEK